MSVNKLPAGAGVPFVHAHKDNEEIYGVLEGAGGKLVDAHLCSGKPEHFVQLDAALIADVGLCVIGHNGSSPEADFPCRHLLRGIHSTQRHMQIRVRTYL